MKYRVTLVLVAMITVRLWADGPTVRPALVYSKAFGGIGNDFATAIAVDSAGNSYIAGQTASSNFPVKGGFQTRRGGVPLRATTDSGTTWFSPDIPDGVWCVAGSSKPGGLLYAGTSLGLYSSADSGQTWQLVTSLPHTLEIHDVVIDTDDVRVLYVASDQGIFKSTDGGATWNALTLDFKGAVRAYSGLTASSASPQTLLAGFSSGLFYRSSDGGASWTPLESVSNVMAMAFDPSDPKGIFALTYKDISLTEFYLFKSTDGGDTWNKLPGTFSYAGCFKLCLAVSPTSLFVATNNGVLRSGDGGNTWAATAITSPANAVIVDPNDPQVIYANADRLYRSLNGGADWSVILSPLPGTIFSLAVPPGTPGSLFVGSLLSPDAFITKLSPDGKQTIYSTYLGGTDFDYPTAIAVDRDGYAWVTGFTYSSDFPVTADALQPKLSGLYNAFLAKISPDGSTLVYSTFLGGSAGDSAQALALDSAGNVYLTGWAGSSDFPVTANALQASLQQGCGEVPATQPWLANGDGFVAKISGDGSALLYSTFLGGTCADVGLGIAVDAAGSAYVTGVTDSPDFPVIKGAYQTTYRSYANSGFLAKLTPQGDGLVYATYIGGADADVSQAVAVDAGGNAYVAGASFGLDEPDTLPFCRTEYALQGVGFPQWSGGRGYVLKLNASGSSRTFAQYMGLECTTGTSLGVDPAGRVWVAGSSGHAEAYPAAYTLRSSSSATSATVETVHPFQGDGLGQGFVTQLSADGQTVLFSSLLDWETAMAVDRQGNAYLSGFTYVADFPKKPSPFSGTPYATPLTMRVDGAVESLVTLDEPKSFAQQPNKMLFYPYVVAPGTMLTMSGSGLGPDQTIVAPTAAGGMLPTTLGGTTVYFDGVAAPLLSVQAQKVICMAPFGLASGKRITVQAERNGARSNGIVVPVSTSAVAILDVRNPDGTINSASHPVPAGSIVSIHATGLGQTDPPSTDGKINGPADARGFSVVLNVGLSGGLSAQVITIRPAPGQPAGITEITVRVPATMRDGNGGLGLTFQGDVDSVPFYVGVR